MPNFPPTITARPSPLLPTDTPPALQTPPVEDLDPSTRATAQASPMYHRVLDLYNQGMIGTPNGTYYRLPDFENSWAQLNGYDYQLTEIAADNFVLRAATEWESASSSANLANSGCGFVFRLNAKGDHYLGYLGLDGWFYLYRNLSRTVDLLGRWHYNPVDIPRGQAKIMIAVDGDRIRIFINDQELQEVQDATFQNGLLGYALISGTNKDFGTRCRMTEVELWEIQ